MLEMTAGSGAGAGHTPSATPVQLRPELTAQLAARIRQSFSTSTPLLMVIRGEPGTGKSRLCREIVAAAAEDDRVVVQTSVAAEQHMSLVGMDDLEEALAPLLGPLDDDPEAGPPTIAALGMRWRRWVERIAQDGPLLVLLDDVHWLDQDSFEVLGFAMRRLRGVPVAVVAAGRTLAAMAAGAEVVESEVAGALAPTRPRRLDLPHRLDVELDRPDADRLAAAIGDLVPGLPGPARERIVEHSRGNVFWARELARAATGDGGYDLSLASPVARERLARLAEALTPTERMLVAAIQLAGRPTTTELLAALGPDAEDPGAALDTAEAAGIVVLGGQRWTTDHPLLGEAALGSLSTGERAALLRRLADVVQDAEQRARMVAQTERPPHEPTAQLLLAAAEAAAERGSPSAAADLMAGAVLFTDEADLERRGERLATVVSLHLRRGAFLDVLRTGEELALDRLSGGAFDAVASALAEAAMFTGGHPAAQAMVGRIEAAADLRGDPMSRAVALGLTSDRDYGTARDRYAASREAAAVLATAPWPSPTAHRVLGTVCTLLLDRGDGLDEELVEQRRALEPALRRAGLMPPATDRADTMWAYVGKQLGDPESSKRRLMSLIEEADRVGEEFAAFAFRVNLVLTHHVCGEFAEAAPVLAEAEASLACLPAPLFPLLLPARVWQAMAEKGAQEAVDLVLAETAAAPGGPPPWRLVSEYLLGSTALAQGRNEDALAVLTGLRMRAERNGLHDPGRRYNVDVLIAETLLVLGDVDGAQREVDALLEFARPRHRDNLVGAGVRIGALIAVRRGEMVAAAEQLEASVEILAGTPYRIEHVRSLVALAVVERQRRRGRVAAALLDEAEEMCDRMPFAVGAQMLRRERAALGAADRSPLTPSELQVAGAIADGATSREAGERLHISPRTVEAHLRSIYRKLDVTGRVGLVALVHSGDLTLD